MKPTKMMVPGPAMPNGTPVGTERTKQVQAMVESLVASGQNRDRAMQLALASVGNGSGSISGAPAVKPIKRSGDAFGPLHKPMG